MICKIVDPPLGTVIVCETAGTGSVLNANGEIEMDAAIMSGSDLSAGSVACVHNIAHPIALARLVMEKVF